MIRGAGSKMIKDIITPTARNIGRACGLAAILCTLTLYIGCKDQMSGGLLGALNTGTDSEPEPIDPLALPPTSQPSGPAADAQKAVHDWIRAAIGAQARINVKPSDAARTIAVDLPGAPPF